MLLLRRAHGVHLCAYTSAAALKASAKRVPGNMKVLAREMWQVRVSLHHRLPPGAHDEAKSWLVVCLWSTLDTSKQCSHGCLACAWVARCILVRTRST